VVGLGQQRGRALLVESALCSRASAIRSSVAAISPATWARRAAISRDRRLSTAEWAISSSGPRRSLHSLAALGKRRAQALQQ